MARLSTAGRWLPVGYFLASVSLAVTVLPSALRPPPQAPPSSAQLSPDSPPEDSEVLLSELARGRSATAGAALAGPEDPLDPVNPELPPPIPKPSRGQCFGNPPRQTESLYSAPCVEAFIGDNGGATTKGVGGNEINIGIAWGGSYDGPLREPGQQGDSDDARRLRVWQSHFNDRYEMYGRRIRVIVVRVGLQDRPEQTKAAVANADEQWPLFAWQGVPANYTAYQEGIRRKIIVYDEIGKNMQAWYRKSFPYAYGWGMNAEQIIAISGELVCKQLAGRPPEFNERMDPTFDYTKPRRFGIIAYDDGIRVGYDKIMSDELAKCGAPVVERQTQNIWEDPSTNAGIVTKMRAAGVTTLVTVNDQVSPVVLTYEATNQGYYPEWWRGIMQETNGLARAYEPTQWRHAFGAWDQELPRQSQYTDCHVAYKAQNPDNTPAAGRCDAYRGLQHFANGIQMAGPRLTPQAFFGGLERIPCRPPQPEWSVGGCFSESDLTYGDYMALAWWDPTATAPDDAGTGAHRFAYDGKRFKLGEMPVSTPWFKEGTTGPTAPDQVE